MARVVIGESRVRARRRRRRALAAGWAAAALLIIFGGIVWLAHASFLRVHTIAVEGAGTIGTQTIQNFVAEDLAGSYWGLFPKDNILLYPKQEVTSDLLTNFPTLESASVAAANFQTLAVEVSQRQATALWCGTEVATTSSCFLLDENGFAYVPSPEFSGDTYYHYYGALSTTSRQFLTPPDFQALSALVTAIAKKEPTEQIQSVYIDENQDVHVTFGDGFVLLFALGDASGDVFEQFSLALQSDPFTTHSLDDFAYLDLRFGDKLYYKLK